MTRVLVAEDETLIRLDLKGLLEAAGFDVCAEARDGEEAVALARETEPDVALLDVKMPRLDGIEAARRILDERPIPIVMVTAYGERELVSRAVEAGVFGYLVKPFRESDLLPAIATATARHEELRALREEADSLAEALAARKAIERAKGILMQREALSEDEAFARLRKASQISGRPLKVVAEALDRHAWRRGWRFSTPTLMTPLSAMSKTGRSIRLAAVSPPTCAGCSRQGGEPKCIVLVSSLCSRSESSYPRSSPRGRRRPRPRWSSTRSTTTRCRRIPPSISSSRTSAPRRSTSIRTSYSSSTARRRGRRLRHDRATEPSTSLPATTSSSARTTRTVTNCDLDDAPNTDFIQNGAPDAIGLRIGSTLVDALSYEGNSGLPYTEGSGAGLEDDPNAGTNGLSRCPDGADTDFNSSDFAFAASTPGAANTCPAPPTSAAIHDIQASAHLSPLSGQNVVTTGIVTALRSSGGNGFYLQDPSTDGDPETAEAIFVFTSTAPTVAVGDAVEVEGLVTEFRPGGASSTNLTTTELTSPAITVLSSGNAAAGGDRRRDGWPGPARSRDRRRRHR